MVVDGKCAVRSSRGGSFALGVSRRMGADTAVSHGFFPELELELELDLDLCEDVEAMDDVDAMG